MLKIYGSPSSSAGRCYWSFFEVDQPFEGISVSFQDKENMSSEFLSLNPAGKIPVLIDEGFALSESMAINFYLAEKFQPNLLGEDLKTKSQVQQWSFWALGDLQSPLIQVFIQKVFVPEEKRSSFVIEKNLKKVPRLLSTLDSSLEGRTFLVGDSFTLADLNVFSAVIVCEAIDYDLTPYVFLKKWMDEVKSRPQYKAYKKYESDWNQAKTPKN